MQKQKRWMGKACSQAWVGQICSADELQINTLRLTHATHHVKDKPECTVLHPTFATSQALCAAGTLSDTQCPTKTSAPDEPCWLSKKVFRVAQTM